MSPFTQVFHCAHVAHDGHTPHVFPVAQVTHCAHVAPTLPHHDVGRVVLQISPARHILVPVMVPAKYPFPFAPSREIPVVVVLVPSDVRNIFQIYCIVFGAIGTILNPLAINNMQDIHRKNRVDHLMKFIPFLFDCRFLVVKLMLTIEVVKFVLAYYIRFYTLYWCFELDMLSF
ncbi:MAG: hypothetical protein WCL18_11020 [bacterium]